MTLKLNTEVEGAWCPQCNRTGLAVCESSLIAGFVHDWVEDVEKCPVCQRTLSYRKIRVDRLRRLQRW